MEESQGYFDLKPVSIKYVNTDVFSINDNSGSPIFTIKNNGDFIPGPGMEERQISEFSKVLYKQMSIFGRSFAETLESKERKIKELEAEILKMKNGSQD